jgi:hypothetical protein
MILTIETNKRSFINAIVALCKTSGILSYKLEDKPLKKPILSAIPTVDKAVEEHFYSSFGAFADEKSADEIIAEIKESRTFTQKDIQF